MLPRLRFLGLLHFSRRRLVFPMDFSFSSPHLGSERFRNVWSGEIQDEPQVNSDHKDLPSEHAHEGIGQREKDTQERKNHTETDAGDARGACPSSQSPQIADRQQSGSQVHENRYYDDSSRTLHLGTSWIALFFNSLCSSVPPHGPGQHGVDSSDHREDNPSNFLHFRRDHVARLELLASFGLTHGE